MRPSIAAHGASASARRNGARSGVWPSPRASLTICPRHLFEFVDRRRPARGKRANHEGDMVRDSIHEAGCGARAARRAADEGEREITVIERTRRCAKSRTGQSIGPGTFRLPVPPQAGKPHDESAVADQRFRHFMLRLNGGPFPLVGTEHMRRHLPGGKVEARIPARGLAEAEPRVLGRGGVTSGTWTRPAVLRLSAAWSDWGSNWERVQCADGRPPFRAARGRRR